MLLWQRLMAQAGRVGPTAWTFTYSTKYSLAAVPTQANMADGSATTYFGTEGTEASGVLMYLMADFGSSKTLSAVNYRAAATSLGWGPEWLDGAVISYSLDGSSWTDITTIASSSDSATTKYTLPSPVSARYVRVSYVHGNSGRSIYLGIGDFWFE